METGLTDRVALVTGGGAGIGLASVRALLAEGARVVAADLDPAAARQYGPDERVLGVEVDLADPGGAGRAGELCLTWPNPYDAVGAGPILRPAGPRAGSRPPRRD